MSAKTSVQPGRRTPLSLSGAVTKTQSNKGLNNVANGSGSNANSHPSPSNNKQDIKLQQQKGDHPTVANFEPKESPNKKQQQQAEKKSQQNEIKKPNEKNQNGTRSSSNKQEANENKQQQQNKEKAQQQNGNDENKVNEKEKKDKSEKSDKSEKPKDKFEKDVTESKEDKKREPNMPHIKKDEKKTKDLKDTKEDKKESFSKSGETTETRQQIKGDDNKSKDQDKEEKVKNVEKKSEEKEEKMDITEDQIAQQSLTSDASKLSSKTNKTSTPTKKTLTKIGDKTPQKPTSTNTVKTTHKREETTTVDDHDIEMEPLTIENSPVKPSQPEEAANIKIVPSATSTPGKVLLHKRNSGVPKSDIQLIMQAESSPDRPRMFSQISGRRSIRPISDYTPSKFQSNLQYRESYRRINTELDATNTSMNVTVGSEVPSNFSFSFFGRGRKRDRTPPTHQSQSAIGELKTDIEVSPPKKARLDIQGLFSVVSSPISLLRNRFSKASLESSTPVKLQQKLNTAEDEIEVQNVSGVSEHDEITTPDKEPSETHLTTDGNNATLGEEAKETKLKTNTDEEALKEVSYEKSHSMEESYEESDIKITETSLQSVAGDHVAKNKRCVVM